MCDVTHSNSIIRAHTCCASGIYILEIYIRSIGHDMTCSWHGQSRCSVKSDCTVQSSAMQQIAMVYRSNSPSHYHYHTRLNGMHATCGVSPHRKGI